MYQLDQVQQNLSLQSSVGDYVNVCGYDAGLARRRFPRARLDKMAFQIGARDFNVCPADAYTRADVVGQAFRSNCGASLWHYVRQCPPESRIGSKRDHCGVVVCRRIMPCCKCTLFWSKKNQILHSCLEMPPHLMQCRAVTEIQTLWCCAWASVEHFCRWLLHLLTSAYVLLQRSTTVVGGKTYISLN